MSPRVLWRLLALAVIGALIYWIASHTYWADDEAWRPPHGEAMRDPFYSAEGLSRALGARASFDRLWALPATDAVVVMAFWDWDRSSPRRTQLEHWVESGGRLVTEWEFVRHSDTFSLWSGVTRNTVKATPAGKPRWSAPGCREAEENGLSLWPDAPAPRHYTLCGLLTASYLASHTPPVWQVTDVDGPQALRIAVGRGSVTVVNGSAFTYTQVLRGTHPALFVAATQLHSGDDLHFISDQDQPSLLALGWRFGAPVVVLLLAALAFALWRAAPRFGPAMAAPESARRSLAEQVRGTGQFLLRVGDGPALHAATVRALLAAATRRISAFSSLSSAERISRLAKATGFPAEALAAAVNYTGARRANELRSAVALLEAARREILRNDNGPTHGN